MIGAVPSFLSAQQAEQIRAEVRVRESALDFDAIDYVNDRMELDRELAREAWGGRFRASLVVCAFIVIGVVLYAGHVWGGGVAMGKPKHFDIGPTAVLADGKNYAQLEEMAKQDKERGIGGDYPKIVRQLLRKYADLVRDTAHLRQPDLFAPSQMTGKKEPRNGI